MIYIGNYLQAIILYFLSLSLFQLITQSIICYFIVLTLRFLIFLFWNIIKQLVPLNDVLKKYTIDGDKKNNECWAVITGATDGIGLGFAQVFTILGFDVCLISRNTQKLENTVDNLKKLRPEQFKLRKIKTIQFDFVNMQDQIKYQQMIQKIKKLDIGIFVNNVGTSLTKPLEDFSYQEIKDIINVNVTSMAVINASILPQLKNRRQKSAIINLSSFAGQSAVPYVTLYSATKAMNTVFSEGLCLQNPEIDILSVRPMFVESPLSRQKKGFNVPDRRQCAYACLKELRWEYQTNGYFLHRIFAKIHQLFVPKFLHRMMSKFVTYKLMLKYNEKKSK